MFTGPLNLTGFGSEECLYLSITHSSVDMRGLLLAGIIIGALGVLDDVTVTQATTVAELAQSPIGRMELYRSATRIGRAHIASAVNTIVLAYAGASLPLLLLVAVSGRDVRDLLSSPVHRPGDRPQRGRHDRTGRRRTDHHGTRGHGGRSAGVARRPRVMPVSLRESQRGRPNRRSREAGLGDGDEATFGLDRRGSAAHLDRPDEAAASDHVQPRADWNQ